MPLRVRLSIAFVAIVLVPLTVTAFLVRNSVSSSFDARATAQLDAAAGTGAAVVTELAARGRTAANGLAERGVEKDGAVVTVGMAVASGDLGTVRRMTDDYAKRELADFLLVLDARNRVLANAVRPGAFQPGFAAPSAEELAKDPTRELSGVTVRGSVGLSDERGRIIGRVVAGYWLDRDVLGQVKGDADDVELTIVVGAKAAATSLGDAGLADDFAARAVDGSYAEYRHSVSRLGGPGGPVMLASVSEAASAGTTGRTTQSIAAVIVVSLLMAGLFGWLLARVTTRPLAELGDAALKVASGRLETKIEVRSRDEVGRLAVAFNTMTDELRTYIQALQDSRDELKRNLTRLGDTLSSTHDLKKMLAVILETAMVTIRAEAGSLMLFSANRDELYLKVGRGLDGRLPSSSVRVQVGDGVAGRVAANGEAAHGTVGVGKGQLRLAPNEPRADSVISVPLKSQGRVIGVLNLYDRVDADEFDDNDLETIRSFANQATVAIDNVLLHQEAQRLSITDGLTGLWNYRYFQMQFDKEIERASRFGRPLALLVLDLDKFKSINDEYGHQRGDSVLIELATRVKGAIRDVDILARYGGEEFVLILPETDLDGAVQAAGKICELVRHRRFGSAGEVPIRITVSIGVAVYPDHGRAGASLLKSADAALYAAKEAGRDGYWIATPMPAIETDEEHTPPRRVPEVAQDSIQGIAAIVTDEVDLGSGGEDGGDDGDAADATPTDATTTEPEADPAEVVEATPDAEAVPAAAEQPPVADADAESVADAEPAADNDAVADAEPVAEAESVAEAEPAAVPGELVAVAASAAAPRPGANPARYPRRGAANRSRQHRSGQARRRRGR